MTEYSLYFAATASTYIHIEADDIEDAIEKAYANLPSGLCAHCSGVLGSARPGIDLGDFELDEGALRSDYPESGF